MNKFSRFAFIVSLLAAQHTQAQHTNIPLGNEEYHLLDRLETRSGSLSGQMHLSIKPVDRGAAVAMVQQFKSDFYSAGLSNIDYYNINRAIALSGEYAAPDGNGAIDSKHNLFNTFYAKQTDFLHLQRNGFLFILNPILGGTGIKENNSGNLQYNATQGVELRAKFRNYAGLYFSIANNYEQPVSFYKDWIEKFQAVPGAGPYKKTGDGYRYAKVRGYATVPLIAKHVSLAIGYDQHFLGDGYRSLFLSDFSEGALFAGISTHIWKLKYQNLYLKLQPQTLPSGEPQTGNKYATAHYLSLNLTRWLNMGLFESVTFSRKGGYDFAYLNPVIFYRAIERGLGSPDKVSIGFSAKAIVAKHLNFYAQVLINEFTLKELASGNGYWANKWGLQLGTKYYDAFGIPNLDIQLEGNVVRPYTFQHYDNAEGLPMTNYTHYNTPLAHPLGAGFAELNVLLNYQPLPRLAISAQGMYYRQGIDTNGSNNGSNLLFSYTTRSSDYGIGFINGPEANCLLGSLNLSYELRPRLYIDVNGTYRKYAVASTPTLSNNTWYASAGLRLNLNRHNYNQF
ncbi:MAG: hypothetical protein QM642_11235 [Edaphocola sp.]